MIASETQPNLAELIQASLRQRLRHTSGSVTFEGKAGGRLILRGKVSTFYQKQLAQEAVRGIEGVNELVNEISVQGA